MSVDPIGTRPRLLIADHTATRLGIRMALAETVDVCAEAADVGHAIRAAKREQPDICLLARELPGDWLSAVRGIFRAAPSAAIVVLAQTSNADEMLDAFRSGAIGYVPGVLDKSALQRIISAVGLREAVVPRSMTMELVLELRATGTEADGLTGRESQVLGMLRRGHTTAAIARQLEIAPVTVRRHISEVVHKLGVEDRAALTAPDSPWAGRPRPASNGSLTGLPQPASNGSMTGGPGAASNGARAGA